MMKIKFENVEERQHTKSSSPPEVKGCHVSHILAAGIQKRLKSNISIIPYALRILCRIVFPIGSDNSTIRALSIFHFEKQESGMNWMTIYYSRKIKI
jgi:hypothetical protein